MAMAGHCRQCSYHLIPIFHSIIYNTVLYLLSHSHTPFQYDNVVSPDAVKVLKSLHISRCQFNDGVERGEVGQNVLVVHKHIVQLSLGLKDLLRGACTRVERLYTTHC